MNYDKSKQLDLEFIKNLFADMIKNPQNAQKDRDDKELEELRQKLNDCPACDTFSANGQTAPPQQQGNGAGNTFETGDVVMLKSGGATMVVDLCDETNAICIWIDDDGTPHTQRIPLNCLEFAMGGL